MGKVVSAEVFLLHRKTIVLATAYGRPAQIRGHVIVKLTDENGLCGWGEATPLPAKRRNLYSMYLRRNLYRKS